MAKKFGIIYDLYARSDLEFMREAAFDPGDGLGSYSHRDKILMLQFKAATGPKKDRKALIWLIKHLLWESKARMTMRKETQTVYVRENPNFYSPAPALEILGIGGLRLLTKEEEGRDLFDGTYFPEDFGLVLDEEERRSWYSSPVAGYFELWFLEAALARKGCPEHAIRTLEEWQNRGCLQPIRQWGQGIPPKRVPGEEVERPSRESCQFKPGQSGNPKGRPKGSKNKSKLVRRDFFDELITVTIDGKKRRLKRRVAFLRRVEEQAVAARDDEIMRLLLDHHIAMSKLQARVPYDKLRLVKHSIGGIRPHSFEGALHALGGGDLLYANTGKARMLLEPWVIELGLAHLGERTLSREEQRIVLFFARHPKRTAWPDWWAADLRDRTSS